MLCSKYFVCTSPDKCTNKCMSKQPLDLPFKRNKVQACYRLNWMLQDEHVREYNWNNITKDMGW